jgi:hypothetical protein
VTSGQRSLRSSIGRSGSREDGTKTPNTEQETCTSGKKTVKRRQAEGDCTKSRLGGYYSKLRDDARYPISAHGPRNVQHTHHDMYCRSACPLAIDLRQEDRRNLRSCWWSSRGRDSVDARRALFGEASSCWKRPYWWECKHGLPDNGPYNVSTVDFLYCASHKRSFLRACSCLCTLILWCASFGLSLPYVIKRLPSLP